MFNLAVISQFLLHYKIINTVSFLRSNRPKVFFKQGVLRKLAKFLGKHRCQSLFFNKFAALSVNFVKFLRTSFFFHRAPLVAASILCRNSFLFCFTVFSECIFINCLKHLKRFCCECEHFVLRA